MSSNLKVNNIQNLAGDDSGIDLSTNDQIILKTANTTAVTVDSSQNVTLAGNLTVTGTASGVGKVLQVVTVAESNSFSTTSSNFNLIISKAITPSSTSSKILVMAVIHGSAQSSNLTLRLAIHRDGTALTGRFNSYAASAGFIAQAIPCIELDSPATTSEVTYSIRGRVSAGSGTVSSGEVCTLTLLEIAG